MVCLTLSACKNKTDENGNPINLRLSGTILDAGGSTLYLEAPSEKGMISIVSSKIDADGSFEMEVNFNGLGFYQLRLGEDKENSIPVTPLLDDELTLNTSKQLFSSKPNISGSIWCENMNTYLSMMSSFKNDYLQLVSRGKQITESEFQKQLSAKRKPVLDFALKQLNTDPSNPYNIVLSMELYPSTGFESWDPDFLVVFKKVADAFSSKYAESPVSNAFQDQYLQLEQGYAQHQQTSAGEVTVPDFELPNTRGEMVKLSDFKGKTVLIDFWASWCGPCRQESPNIVKLYRDFKDKPFVILSVSLDNDKTKWLKAIVDDKLDWSTHVSDLKGWESPMVQLFKIEGIPHTLIVNPEGKLVGQDLRGEALYNKISELINSKP